MCYMHCSKHLGFIGEQNGPKKANIPAPVSLMFYPGEIENEQ